jgi:DeoR family transcriptional regulator, deoxyribose operon repressor
MILQFRRYSVLKWVNFVDKQQQRMNEIVRLLSASGMQRVADLAERTGVSEVTVRRDLRRLEDDGLVFLAHGAASINPGSENLRIGDKYFITQQQALHQQEKIQIGRKAATLVEPHDTLVIDSGTTPYYLARALPANFDLTVICVSLNVFIELHDRTDVNLIFTGGYYHRNSLMCESEEGISMIRRHRAAKAFLGATGIHEKMGVTSSNPWEQKTKRAIMESSLTNILLVDSDKFRVVQTSYFADLHEFDIVVSDSAIPPRYVSHIENSDARLVVAEAGDVEGPGVIQTGSA